MGLASNDDGEVAEQTGRLAAEASVVVGADGLARPAWAASNPLLREYYDTEWACPFVMSAGCSSG